MTLHGKVALVTGSTKGIGLSIASAMRNYGASVICTGRSVNDDSDMYIPVDFSDSGSVEEYKKLLTEKIERTGIDICINNVGTNIVKPFSDYTNDEYELLMDTNLRSAFETIKIVSEKMKEKRKGHIVNIASIWGTKTKSGRSLYTMTKSALIGMTKTIAVELAPWNIMVNCVSPGFTMTELTQRMLGEDGIAKIRNDIPMQRLATTDEIAKAVAFLSSPDNTYITGHNLIVDGGFSCV